MNVEEPTTASSPQGQTSTTHTHSTSTSSNLLNVPGQSLSSGSSHQRSSSFGSSGTSGWTPSPSSALASSDIGEDKSEERDLLKTDEPEIPDNPFAFVPKQLSKL